MEQTKYDKADEGQSFRTRIDNNEKLERSYMFFFIETVP